MVMNVKTADMKKYVDDMLFERGWNDFIWDDDTLSDGEIEYQMTSYTNGLFRSILVRFCDDDTHTYREFFETNYYGVSDLLYDTFDDRTIDYLCGLMEVKMDILHM